MPPARASRTGESAAVLAVVREGAAGKPGLAPVMGDAGIGKTRLVDALVAELGEQGPLVLSGHCSMGRPRRCHARRLSTLCASCEAVSVPTLSDASSTPGPRR
jgi:predicted ATPase